MEENNLEGLSKIKQQEIKKKIKGRKTRTLENYSTKLNTRTGIQERGHWENSGD